MNRRGLQPLGVVVPSFRLLKSFHLLITLRKKFTERIIHYRLSRKHPELLEVFNLIVKNGKNRRESIAELAANGRTEEVANALYWKHLKKISFFFKVPY